MQHSTVENMLRHCGVKSTFYQTEKSTNQCLPHCSGTREVEECQPKKPSVLTQSWQHRSLGGEGLERRRVPHSGEDVVENLFPALHLGSRDQRGWHPYLLSRAHLYQYKFLLKVPPSFSSATCWRQIPKSMGLWG